MHPTTRMGTVAATLLAALAALAPPAVAPSEAEAAGGQDIVIVLDNSFIDAFKNRVTLEATMKVDKAGDIHPADKDGDMHFAGRAPEVGLPIVAEIQNAKMFESTAVERVHKAEGKAAIKVEGVWRFWCEHAGTGTQKQGAPLSKFNTSNPPHVFELHPTTKVDGVSTLESFVPIAGFKYKDAHRAFLQYENTSCRIKPEGSRTSIRTRMTGFNIVEFVIESREDPEDHLVVDDGRFVRCRVFETDGELISHEVRTAYVKDSKPEAAIKALARGKRLRVVGIPRIDLALVDWRVENKDDPRDPLTWHLPYEMVIVAVFDP